jgi:hypothetical protein
MKFQNIGTHNTWHKMDKEKKNIHVLPESFLKNFVGTSSSPVISFSLGSSMNNFADEED